MTYVLTCHKALSVSNKSNISCTRKQLNLLMGFELMLDQFQVRFTTYCTTKRGPTSLMLSFVYISKAQMNLKHPWQCHILFFDLISFKMYYHCLHMSCFPWKCCQPYCIYSSHVTTVLSAVFYPQLLLNQELCQPTFIYSSHVTIFRCYMNKVLAASRCPSYELSHTTNVKRKYSVCIAFTQNLMLLIASSRGIFFSQLRWWYCTSWHWNCLWEWTGTKCVKQDGRHFTWAFATGHLHRDY